MEAQVWYTINLGTEPANYHIGDFNCALFTVELVSLEDDIA